MLKLLVKRTFSLVGYDLLRKDRPVIDHFSEALTSTERLGVDLVRPYTMTSTERIVGLIDAIRYVSRANIPGAIVECGVWRGGSMMAAAQTLLTMGCRDRDLYLFDTFEGMPEPAGTQLDYLGRSAGELLSQSRTKSEAQQLNDVLVAWSPLNEVKANLSRTGYPAERCHYVAGKVEDSLPQSAPVSIAVLRLDTDWYESTKHELTHLFPRLAPGGVLIVDDYGHWEGAQRAVDEYFASTPVLFHRIDYTGRMLVKTSSTGRSRDQS
jgi:O-methyltransferase